DPSYSVSQGDAADTLNALVPRGWYAQEKAHYCRFFDVLLAGGIDAGQGRIIPGKIQAGTAAFESEIYRGIGTNTFDVVMHHRLLAIMMLPALSKVTERTADVQAAVDEALFGCALERYRLANGRWPDKLEELAP